MISIYYCSPVRFLEKIQATWVKRRFHMHQSQKVFFFAIRNHTSQVLELSCRLRTWIFEVQRKFHTFSDGLKGVPRDMFSWIAANNKQKIWRRSCWIDKMVASKRIVQSFDTLCSVLVAGGKLAIVVAGEEKTNNEYDERVVYETQWNDELWSYWNTAVRIKS